MDSKFEKIKEFISIKIQGFLNISGLSKFVLVLCILITIFNVGGNIYSANKIDEAQVSINQKVEEQKDLVNDAFSGLGMQDTVQLLCDSFSSIGKVAMSLIAFLISIVVAIFVYYIYVNRLIGFAKLLRFLQNLMRIGGH